MSFQRVAIIGLGLLGGSIGLAIGDIAGEPTFRDGRYTTSYLTERGHDLPSLR